MISSQFPCRLPLVSIIYPEIPRERTRVVNLRWAITRTLFISWNSHTYIFLTKVMQNPNKLDRINYCEYSAFGDPFSLVASCSLSRDFRVYKIQTQSGSEVCGLCFMTPYKTTYHLPALTTYRIPLTRKGPSQNESEDESMYRVFQNTGYTGLISKYPVVSHLGP